MSFRQIQSFDLNDYVYGDDTECETIAEDARIIKEIFEDLNQYTLDAQEPMEHALHKTSTALVYVDEGTSTLKKASSYNKRKHTLILISVASILGACIGGPLGGAGVAGITTSIAGTTTVGGIVGGAIVGSVTGGGILGVLCSLKSRLRNRSC
tara:strand:+ start:1676 stop:2134 length:459 start_codon:yes stop_codon:yes gene_type:complete